MRDVKVFQYMPKGPFLLKDSPAHHLRETIEVNLDCTKFDWLLSAFQVQDHLAKILVPAPFASENAQMHTLTMEILQSRSHVVLVDQKSFVRLRHQFSFNLFTRGQRSSTSCIEFIQRMDNGKSGLHGCARHNGYCGVPAERIRGATGRLARGLPG